MAPDELNELQRRAHDIGGYGRPPDYIGAAIEEIERLRAALAEREWRPIESAPRDTPILATDGKVVVALALDKDHNDMEPNPVGFGGWDWDWDFAWRDLTHWMPLPEPPRGEG